MRSLATKLFDIFVKAAPYVLMLYILIDMVRDGDWLWTAITIGGLLIIFSVFEVVLRRSIKRDRQAVDKSATTTMEGK